MVALSMKRKNSNNKKRKDGDFDHEYPSVIVTWADHYSDFDDGFTLERVEQLVKEPMIRKTQGFLVCEGPRQLALAGTVESDGTFSELFICMKRAIIRIDYMDTK